MLIDRICVTCGRCLRRDVLEEWYSRSKQSGPTSAVLGAAFHSGIMFRFGLWGEGVGYIAMAISFGLKSPLDYGVFSAAGAALLLALSDSPRPNV